MKYVSRAGQKLEHALKASSLSTAGLVCADFGSSTGGFVDCLLQNGAEKIYAVEKGYGVLDWKLRSNKKVTVLERTNAIHVTLPEKVDLISIDTGWTKLENVIPNALKNLKENGFIIALIKPHYEADKHMLYKGKVKDEFVSTIVDSTIKNLKKFKLEAIFLVESPVLGEKGKNREFLLCAKKGLTS